MSYNVHKSSLNPVLAHALFKYVDLILVDLTVKPLQLKSAANAVVSRGVSTSLKRPPAWALLSIVSNVLLLVTVFMLLLRDESGDARLQTRSATTPAKSELSKPISQPELGPRHQWSYEQWVAQLKREAEAAAQKKPERLMVLAGDSISLWFPAQLLPADRTWLNQGISGETSEGLLKRLPLLDSTRPRAIFVMIGINDLIRGVTDETILYNQRQIIQDLRWVHPDSQIVVQSILPHGGAKATWEGRDRLLSLKSDRLRSLNEQLAAIAAEEGVYYLDLYSLFSDPQGYLRPELTTDGLHLNEPGYLVWRTALQLFSQVQLQQ